MAEQTQKKTEEKHFAPPTPKKREPTASALIKRAHRQSMKKGPKISLRNFSMVFHDPFRDTGLTVAEVWHTNKEKAQAKRKSRGAWKLLRNANRKAYKKGQKTK